MQQNLLISIPLLILLVPFMFLPPIIAYIIAKNRGRSGGNWFVIGLLFGWIAVLVVVCIADLKKQPCLYLSAQTNKPLSTQQDTVYEVQTCVNNKRCIRLWQ